MMRYLSVCAGIEAATVAWHPLGWTPAAFSEIDAFPRAVLAHHYPDVPLHGDFTTIRGDEYGPVQLLVGGTPCQSFSVAGLRKGLDDNRGNLALQFCLLARRTRPQWVLWENVPGVLSLDRGRAFASILGGLAECGYGLAYRVLDAQFVRVDGFARAVPQRRRRVFVVGYLGDWRRAAAVLFERSSMSGHSPPRRQPGQVVAGTVTARVGSGGVADENHAADGHLVASSGDVSHCLNAGGMRRIDFESETSAADVSPTLRAGGNATGGDRPVGTDVDTIETLVTHAPTISFDCKAGAKTGFAIGDVPSSLRGSGHGGGHSAVLHGWRVRRLMPVECERLQGFPDGYTDVPHRGKRAADGPRYKAVGNSMSVNVMRWIGARIAAVDAITTTTKENEHA